MTSPLYLCIPVSYTHLDVYKRQHLDNRACAAEILDLIQEGCKKFALCHLSQTNNSPELALTTVYNVLLAAGIQPGRDVLIQAQERNDISPYIEF